jgi:[protein-PII] uridylyltransferase
MCWALMPEWAGIECLVVRDFYHRYTVDEHTLVAIHQLELLPASEDPLRQRFATLLEEAVDRPSLLATLLFHDTGKASRSGKHVGVVRLAETALKRLGAPVETSNLV